MPKPTHFLLAALLFWLALTLPALTVYPTPHMDEGWLAGMALNLLRDGNYGLPLIPDLRGTAENYIHNGRLYTTALAGWIALTGFDAFTLRLFSVFGALLTTALTFALGRRLVSPTVGLLAALVLLFGWRLLYAGHFLRPDIWVSAAGLALAVAVLRLKPTSSPWVYFAFGLALLVLADVYSSMVFQVVTLTALLGVHLLLSSHGALPWRGWVVRGVLFGLGGALGLAYWLAVRAFPDPALALAQYRFLAETNFRLGEQTLLSPLLNLMTQYLGPWFWSSSRLSPLDTAYLLVGVAGLLVWHSPAGWRILTATLVWPLALVYLVPSVTPYHLTSWLPWLALALATTTVHAAAAIAPRLPQFHVHLTPPALALAALTPLLAANLLGTAYLSLGSLRVSQMPAYAAALQTAVAPTESVFGNGAWYITLRAPTYTDYWYLSQYEKLPDLTNRYPTYADFVTATFAERGVTTVLLDSALTEPALHDLVAAHCTPTTTIALIPFGLDMTGSPILTTEVYTCPPWR